MSFICRCSIEELPDMWQAAARRRPSRLGATMDFPAVAAQLRRTYDRCLDPDIGFLPSRVPLESLPPPFDRYLTACAELPDRFPKAGVRRWLDELFAEGDPALC